MSHAEPRGACAGKAAWRLIRPAGRWRASLSRHVLAGLLLGSGIANSVWAATFSLPPPGADVVGRVQVVAVGPQDTLLDIARRYDLGYNEIVAANPGVDPWLPRAGTHIVLPTQFVLPDAPRRGIVLNLAAMRLYYYPVPRSGRPPVVVTYPIGIGRMNWASPIASTKVWRKEVNPVWHTPVSIRDEHAAEGEVLPEYVAPGPNNPLGQYALRLGIPGYLIHGTNQPYGIGRRVSHGCIHLYPEDIAALFGEVDVGTPVRFVDQPYLAGWLDGELYFEAHPPLEETREAFARDLTPAVAAIVNRTRGNPVPVDWDRVLAIARLARSVPVRVSPPAVPAASR